MAARSTWQLKEEEHKVFQGFDFVSNKVFEEELTKAFESGFGAGSLAGSPAGHHPPAADECRLDLY